MVLVCSIISCESIVRLAVLAAYVQRCLFLPVCECEVDVDRKRFVGARFRSRQVVVRSFSILVIPLFSLEGECVLTFTIF